jgi:16S rRNA processing protein RimM
VSRGESPVDYLVVGHIERPHGTRGEVAVRVLTDHPEDVYRPGVVLRGSRDGEGPDPDFPPLRIEDARPVPGGQLVFFGGVEDRDTAETLRGTDLMAHRDSLTPLAEGEVYLHDLEGLEVRSPGGERIGDVVCVYDLQPAPLLEIRRSMGATVMLPYRAEFVPEVDVDAGWLVVDPPAGLFDLDAS